MVEGVKSLLDLIRDYSGVVTYLNIVFFSDSLKLPAILCNENTDLPHLLMTQLLVSPPTRNLKFLQTPPPHHCDEVKTV